MILKSKDAKSQRFYNALRLCVSAFNSKKVRTSVTMTLILLTKQLPSSSLVTPM